MGSRADFGALDQMIAGLGNIARLAELGAPEAAKRVEASLRATASAGQSPDGKPWPPTKAGERPLKGAAAAITVTVLGTVILIKLTGHHVFHHFGAGSSPKRQVIPEGSLPGRLGDAIRQGFVEPFRKAAKGGGS